MRPDHPADRAPADRVLAISADPTDPNRCVVRFGTSGPSRNLGASPERVAAYLHGEQVVQRALPELDAGEREFLLFGPDAPDAGEEPPSDPNLVTVEADPSDPRRSLLHFAGSGRQRALATDPARLAAFLRGRLAARIEIALPELDERERAFVHEGLAALPLAIPHVELRPTDHRP